MDVTYSKLDLFDEVDVEHLEKFHREVVGDAKNIKDYKWEYGRDTSRAVMWAARGPRGRIVATQGGVPIDLCFEGTQVRAVKSESSYASPDLRGSGVFPRLYERFLELESERGTEVVWGVTSAVKVMKRLGFAVHSDLFETSVPLWEGLEFSRLAPSLMRAVHGAGNLLSLLSRIVVDNCRGVELSAIGVLGTAMIPESPKNHVSITTDRDYLRWRWRENPWCRNLAEIGSYCSKDHLSALAVVNVVDRVGYLSTVKYSSVESLRQVLLSSLSFSAVAGCHRVLFVGNYGSLRTRTVFSELRLLGAKKPWRYPLSFVARPLKPTFERVCDDFSRWEVDGMWMQGVKY